MLDLHQVRKHIRELNDSDDSQKREALQSLRQHDKTEWAAVSSELSHAVVESLREHLQIATTQPATQKDMATILGNIGPSAKSAIPELTALLQKGVPDTVREAAVIALGKIGKEARDAVNAIVRLLEDARPTLATHAIRALGNIGHAPNNVRTALVNLWLSPQQYTAGKSQVAVALCKLRIPAQNLRETITRSMVADQDTALRKAAAEALAWCNPNDTDVVPALLTASLHDSNEEVRNLAQAGMDHMHVSHKKAIQLCARQLGESTYAEAALRKSGAPAVPALMEALGREEPAVRLKAARTLGFLGEPAAEAAPALTATLHDKDPDVRLEAVKALWNVTKTSDVVVPALVDLLKTRGAAEASEVRRRYLQTVMEAISRIGPLATAAVPALTGMAKDANRNIRESAVATLQKIAPAVAAKAGTR